MTPDIAPAIDREKLGKLLGMLGSAHDGEVLAAARQAEKLRQQVGLTWPEILSPTLSGPPGRPSPVREPADDRQPFNIALAIAACRENPAALTIWEVNFIEDIAVQTFPLSPRQLAVLEKCARKAIAAAKSAPHQRKPRRRRKRRAA